MDLRTLLGRLGMPDTRAMAEGRVQAAEGMLGWTRDLRLHAQVLATGTAWQAGIGFISTSTASHAARLYPAFTLSRLEGGGYGLALDDAARTMRGDAATLLRAANALGHATPLDSHRQDLLTLLLLPEVSLPRIPARPPGRGC